MKLTWLSLLKFCTPLTVYVWQNHIHVVHYHTLKVIVYKINNCIYLNYNKMNGIKVITLMRENACNREFSYHSQLWIYWELKVIIYHELFPIFNVLFRIFTIFLCVTHILRCAYLSLMSLNLFLPSWNTFTCFHNFFLFSPLSFSPFFLQEPQTTVIHNPVDGIKVHPPPFCPHLFSYTGFHLSLSSPHCFSSHVG